MRFRHAPRRKVTGSDFAGASTALRSPVQLSRDMKFSEHLPGAAVAGIHIEVFGGKT